jgi:RNase P subunit RPR2
LAEIAVRLKDYSFTVDYCWMLSQSTEHVEFKEKCQFLYEFALYQLNEKNDLERKETKSYRRFEKKLKKEMKRSAAYKKF